MNFVSFEREQPVDLGKDGIRISLVMLMEVEQVFLDEVELFLSNRFQDIFVVM